MKTLEDILIASGDLALIYNGNAALHLWRAVPKITPIKTLFTPISIPGWFEEI